MTISMSQNQTATQPQQTCSVATKEQQQACSAEVIHKEITYPTREEVIRMGRHQVKIPSQNPTEYPMQEEGIYLA